MATLYLTPRGDILTTCGGHRKAGYAIQPNGNLRCRECGLSDDVHETLDETLARRRDPSRFGCKSCGDTLDWCPNV